jgi:uncharacterized protein (TIGR02145 family)
MKKITFLFTFLFAISAFSFADTHIPAGDVSGTWAYANSPYIIDGEINIQVGNELTIEPGVQVLFSGYYKFNIYGRLLAVGTVSDTIVFTKQNAYQNWHGLRFYDTFINGQDSSKVVYCKLEYGSATGYNNEDVNGGAIYCNGASVEISNCLISNNTAEGAGGGIFSVSSALMISDNTIINNSVDATTMEGYGGGIFCSGENNIIQNNTISNNSIILDGGPAEGGGILCDGTITIYNNIISDNFINCYGDMSGVLAKGGGICCPSFSFMDIQNNQITGNRIEAVLYGMDAYAETFGGGVYIADPLAFSYNLIADNEASAYTEGEYISEAYAFGGGLYCTNSDNLLNNTITGNSVSATAEMMDNCSWIDNESDCEMEDNCYWDPELMECVPMDYPVEEAYGDGVYFESNSTMLNCIVWDNSYWNGIYGSVGIMYSDIQGSWYGDGNINLDPKFADPANKDYHLSWANYPIPDATKSPCIDAGDPDPQYNDPDGTRNDMGAFYFPTNTNAIQLNLKVFLEGPFNGTDMDTDLYGDIPLSQPFNTAPWNYSGTENVVSIPNNDVVDWMLIELRETTGDSSTAYSSTMIERQAVFVLNDGAITGLDGISNPEFDVNITQNLFVVLWHRNHIGIMSTYPLTESGGIYTYDFTIPVGQAYGTGAQKDLGSVYGMFAADGNVDGTIDEFDITGTWATDAGNSGYLNGDFDLDTQADNKDKDDVWLVNEGEECQVPGEIVINCGDTIIDYRDGQSYNTIQIGSQCWMAEYLNIGTMVNGSSDQSDNGIIEKYCYDNNTSNCDTYGGLYQWNEIMQYVTTPAVQGICPPGWHLPADDEWKTMEMYLGMEQAQADATGWRGTDEGGKLKESGTDHWTSPNTGATNSSGFTALPTGHRNTNGNFWNLTNNGQCWSSTEDGYAAWNRYLEHTSAQVWRSANNKMDAFGVRCIKD